MENNQSIALITPSYAADFERCRLLCDSVDRFVADPVDHYILVDDDDFLKFSELSGAHRHIVNEMDILPDWLHVLRPGIGKSVRKIWWSTKTWPMRGWHIQQLRRIAIAAHIFHDGLLYCDSDMLFVRPFDPKDLWEGDDLRLYRKPFAIDEALISQRPDHKRWTCSAAELLDLPIPEFPAHDYINNLVSWRRESVLQMCSRIEQTTGKNWVAALGSLGTFSECQIFGAYCDDVLSGEGCWIAQEGLCETYWSGEALNATSIRSFVDGIKDTQVAIGIQSFTGTDPDDLRPLLSG